MLSEPLLVVATLVRVFDTMKIRYVVGGSIASLLYGIPRATQDVDLVAEVGLGNVEDITTLLAGEFYVDASMIRDAIRRSASFNVIQCRPAPVSHDLRREARKRRAEFTSDQLLRTILVMEIEELTYRATVIRIDDSEFLRRFVGLYHRPMMDYTMLRAPLLEVSAQLNLARRSLLSPG